MKEADGASGRTLPPTEWAEAWARQHRSDIVDQSWLEGQNLELYDQIKIAEPIRPVPGDLLVYSDSQFHRLLAARSIRVLFFMGFETNVCLQRKTYGMAQMSSYGYSCNVVRDCTTTYESAETLRGLWRTKVAVEATEDAWGYSVTSTDLVSSVKNGL